MEKKMAIAIPATNGEFLAEEWVELEIDAKERDGFYLVSREEAGSLLSELKSRIESADLDHDLLPMWKEWVSLIEDSLEIMAIPQDDEIGSLLTNEFPEVSVERFTGSEGEKEFWVACGDAERIVSVLEGRIEDSEGDEDEDEDSDVVAWEGMVETIREAISRR